MKGNERLGLTAELVALIRDEQKADKYSHYFVTHRARRIYSVFSLLFSKATIQRIFDKRTKLSHEIHKLVEQYSPEQVIEIASGSSTFGLEYSQKHPKVVYIETDMGEVIGKKRSILEKILQDENLRFNPNHILVSVDVLNDDIYKALQKHIKRGKRTIIIAEGLTSYFDDGQFETFLNNVGRILDKTDGGSYLSHESIGKKMTSGFGGKILRGFVSVVTRSKFHQHFKSTEELKNYFGKRGYKEIKHIEGSSGSYVYIMGK